MHLIYNTGIVVISCQIYGNGRAIIRRMQGYEGKYAGAGLAKGPGVTGGVGISQLSIHIGLDIVLGGVKGEIDIMVLWDLQAVR